MVRAPDTSYIYIQALNKKWRPGVKFLEDEGMSEYYDDFLQWMAYKFKDEVVEAINDQTYKRRFYQGYTWPPLSIGYYKYKEKHNLSLKMWEATGFLKNHIEVIDNRMGAYVVGFSPFLKYPQTNVSPIMISKVLEWGNDKCPARPLFRPVQRYMATRVRKYFDEYTLEV